MMASVSPYLPIQDGCSVSNIDLNIQKDNEGDNISSKNPGYAELTGMYWAWKNLKNVYAIGLCHYRRYFDFHNQCDSLLPTTRFKTEYFNQINLDVPQTVVDHVESGFVYVAKPRLLRESLYSNYCRFHIPDDIRILERYVMTTQSEEFKRAWYNIIHRSREFIPYNMFFMKWELFDLYCSWLFPLLKDIESQTDITDYAPSQMRIYGYMAERLFNVWLSALNLETIKTPIILFDDYSGGKSSNHLKLYCKFI